MSSPPTPAGGDTERFTELLGAASEGSESAWHVLARSVGPVVLAYCRARGADEPEDVLGEVFVDLVRGIRRFAGDEAGFRAWAVTIARSRMIDERRRRRRRPSVPTADVPEVSTHPDPADEVTDVAWVRQALASLPEDQREIVALRVVVGLSVGETARIVGKKPGAVRVAHHRALARLRAGYPERDVTQAATASVRKVS